MNDHTLFDAHCHLQDAAFNEDRTEILAASQAAGVSHFLVPATDAASFGSTLDLTSTHDTIFCALGIHPHSANEWNSGVRDEIHEAFLSNDKIVAIGEIGLDYHYDFSPRDVQRKAFACPQERRAVNSIVSPPAWIGCTARSRSDFM